MDGLWARFHQLKLVANTGRLKPTGDTWTARSRRAGIRRQLAGRFSPSFEGGSRGVLALLARRRSRRAGWSKL